MGQTGRAWDLRHGWRGDESCKRDMGINESNGKQDWNAVQEKGTKEDKERELRPGARPL